MVGAQGQCQPGMGIKTFPDWTSIFVAVPNLPAKLLRNIASYAGVHIFNKAGDVLDATHQLLSVHTLSGGQRTFTLPGAVEIVYDLFNEKTIARNTNQFHDKLPPSSSMFYYFGDSHDLLELKNH